MTESERLFARARAVIPGGVNSPVRAFKAVGGTPLFFARAEGAYVVDEDGRRYVDYVGSWGPMILGHAHPEVVAAVRDAAARGLSFGAPTRIELEMAELLCEFMPSLERVRMVSSGTEAAMSAVRLARAHTGRDRIVKFEGGYHGHADSLLVKAGSGALTFGVPTSPGVPAAVARDTLSLAYNDLEAAKAAFAAGGDAIAAVIVEPVAGNMGCVPPVPGFLEGLRALCDAHGAVLIFDEVITGFRVALNGAQGLFGVRPDLTVLGKIIGGGLPVGAFGGAAAIMARLAPEGPVYQAGTLSGNPVAMAAGLATLKVLRRPGVFAGIAMATARLAEGLAARATAASVPLVVHHVGGLFGFFFTDARDVRHFAEVTRSDAERFRRFFHALIRRGVYLAPSPFEAGFVSAAHGEHEIDATLAAAAEAFAERP